jgi:hypothetical protein
MILMILMIGGWGKGGELRNYSIYGIDGIFEGGRAGLDRKT